MRWSFFYGATFAALLISLFEWPKLKQKPKKDKAVFVSLLLIGWLLSILDLPHTPGPTTFLEFVFKPFKGLVEE